MRTVTLSLVVNSILLAVSNCAAPLLLRLYFIKGGKRIWLSSWLQTGGCPIMLIPLIASYFRRRSANPTTAKLVFMDRPIFIAAASLGVALGFDNYFYSYGLAKLPVSTASLLIATQLAFTAVFTFFLVKQKFSFYSTNAVVLLTAGACVLALHTSRDRPNHESNKEYVMGFVLTLLAAALYGLIMPLVELTYKKAKKKISYTLVMEFQFVLCFFATVVCTVGMLTNNDFKVIPRVAREFGLGETKYYVIVVWCAIMFQCFFFGVVGVIVSGSSLLSAVLIAVLLPVIEVLAVIFFHERFQAEKGVALGLSLWGFFSYFYGEFKRSRKKDATPQADGVTRQTSNNSPENNV